MEEQLKPLQEKYEAEVNKLEKQIKNFKEYYEEFKEESVKFISSTGFCKEKSRKLFFTFRKELDKKEYKISNDFTKDFVTLRLVLAYAFAEDSENKYENNRMLSNIDKGIFENVMKSYLENRKFDDPNISNDLEPVKDAKKTKDYFVAKSKTVNAK